MSTNQNPDIEIKLNKEFNKVKLTPQERKSILEEYNGLLIDKEEALAQLSKGGVLVAEAEDLLSRAGTDGDL